MVSILGACFFVLSKASGMMAGAFFARHCLAPAGLFSSSYSKPNRFSKKLLLNFVGVLVQVTSGPPVMQSGPMPVLYLLFQPRPWSSRAPASGSGPTSDGSPAPWVLPKLWPPAINATVSSSFIAMRRNVSRMSLAAAFGSGLPFGPSGFT